MCSALNLFIVFTRKFACKQSNPSSILYYESFHVCNVSVLPFTHSVRNAANNQSAKGTEITDFLRYS